MARLLVKAALACLVASLAAPPSHALEGRVGPEDVREAIEKGSRALLKSLDGRSATEDWLQSRTLSVVALLNCGVPADHPTLTKAIANLVRDVKTLTQEQYHGCYQGGLLLMMFGLLHDERYQAIAGEVARRLQRFQELGGGWGDNSRSQFALLGLKAALDLGIEVPEAVFKSAYKYVVSGQNPDGGWGYTPQDRRSYGSMTVAGVTSLFICGARAYQGTKVCGEASMDRRLAAGLEWCARNFTVRGNPGVGGGNHFYYLYGLERIGVLMAQRTIGGHDWYREGATFLVNTQTADGTWVNEWLATEYALLFLGKGRQPVAIQKLHHDGDWNADPYDVKELTERAAKDLKTPMTFQIVDSQASATELAAAPILYLQGHGRFSFSSGFREAVRAFVEQGGFVLASACCGDKVFDKAVRSELQKVFPDASFEPLPPDHAVYAGPHRITEQAGFVLEALSTGCRTSVFYAPHDLCCGWGGCEGCKDPKAVPSELARQLGVNFIAHALGFRPLRDKLEEVRPVAAAPTEAKLKRGALVVGHLFHSGGWDLDSAALPNLLQTLREQVGMKGEAGQRRVVLGADDPGEYPLLYLIGYRDFSYTPAQIKVLREYLDRGGFLFAECGCGRAEFDRAFRRLCEKLYPDEKLTRLPADHAVFEAPFRIERVRYKPSVARSFPQLGDAPHLEGITHQNRLTVVYSRFNLSCELQGRTDPASLGVLNPDAYRLAVNAVLYALSH